MSQNHRDRALLLLGLTCFNPACTSWQPVALPTPADTNWALVHRLRVTDRSGGQTAGSMAVIRDTTLVVTGEYGVAIRIPLGQVAFLERGKANVLGTIGVVYLVIAVVTTVIVLVSPPEITGGGAWTF